MSHEINIDKRHSPFNMSYLQRMLRVIANATAEHPRTMAVRVDLRLPDDTLCLRQNLIAHFIESLNAKIDARYKSKLKQGKRTYLTHLRYTWVREIGEINQRPHYHVVLFVNNDTFNGLGSYSVGGTGLGSLIQGAWLSALQQSYQPEYRTLVHFPQNPLYYLDINAGTEQFKDAYDSLTFRMSYMAKERTKLYSRSERSFGCSQC